MQTKLQLQVDLVDYLFRKFSDNFFKVEIEDIVAKGYDLKQAINFDPDDEYFKNWNDNYIDGLIDDVQLAINRWECEEPDCDTPQELIDEVVNNINLREEII